MMDRETTEEYIRKHCVSIEIQWRRVYSTFRLESHHRFMDLSHRAALIITEGNEERIREKDWFYAVEFEHYLKLPDISWRSRKYKADRRYVRIIDTDLFTIYQEVEKYFKELANLITVDEARAISNDTGFN